MSDADFSVTIPKNPVLKTAEDYYRLRQLGIGLIEKMGSQLWTDYNVHDPGITILECICYAITDLAYRIGWDIKDLLTPAKAPSGGFLPYPMQPFFTARDILTINASTPEDLRRVLIDLDGVRNAWIFPRDSACDVSYYASCDKDELRLSYKPLGDESQPVFARGLYDVMLELEADPEVGDLNDNKIEYAAAITESDQVHRALLEFRFPKGAFGPTDRRAGSVKSAKFIGMGATKTYDVFGDQNLDDDMRNEYLRSHWRDVLYVGIEVTWLAPDQSESTFAVERISMRVFSDSDARNGDLASFFLGFFAPDRCAAIVRLHSEKAEKRGVAVEIAKTALQSCRNLDEDYCQIKVMNVQDVAACADVELEPEADIELVQAKILLEIEKYFNPPVRFHTLDELLQIGVPVEDIFNGPKLRNGFITGDDLDSSCLRSVLYGSDIINKLMDIDGVVAVNHLQLTGFDSEGNPIAGAADPDLHGRRDENRISASWTLYVMEQHQPRLYVNGSRFVFYKSGLPFLPRMDEVRDTITQLRGAAERPKIKNAPEGSGDLPVPGGTFRDPEDYFPIQNSLPSTYGTGPYGLASNASDRRRAQALQLKAYLMAFDQILGNAFAQIAHAGELFSLDPEARRTYFVKKLSGAIVTQYDTVVNGLNQPTLEAMIESASEAADRRNRFLDHVMARFGEQFTEYALLLTGLEGRRVALDQLIDDKIAFLTSYPSVSSNRARAFNKREFPCAVDNQPGLKRRIGRLLAFPCVEFAWLPITDLEGRIRLKFQLQERGKPVWTGYMTVADGDREKAKRDGRRSVVARMSVAANYRITKKVVVGSPDEFVLRLAGTVDEPHGRYLKEFDTQADAESARDRLVAWAAFERMMVVEHLLLRPKFPGDALYPSCCGDEDPYSFRLTFVAPGWIEPFKSNMDMRDFIDRTIQEEMPSHLLGKICWVGNDGFVADPCDPVIDELARLLETKGATSEGTKPPREDACACANSIYDAFAASFKLWFVDKILDYIDPDALKAILEAEFGEKVHPSDITCTTLLEPELWQGIQAAMVRHFQDVALNGYQFERFELAWCNWLEADAAIDWTEERLQDRVEAILGNNVADSPDQGTGDKAVECALDILRDYGQGFYDWMRENVTQHKTPAGFGAVPDFVFPSRWSATFKPEAAGQIADLVKNSYGSYVEVSYRLRVVVNLLNKLNNIYPAATLHDWDEGNDQNAVRLGKTALGS